MRVAVWLALLPALVFAQAPRIALIDFYGLKKTPEAAVRKKLGFQEGDRLPPSKGAVEESLETLDTVVLAHLEAVCCEAGGAILYVGIEERGAPHFSYHNWPEGEAYLPDELLALHREFVQALREEIRKGELKEDYEAGGLYVSSATVARLQAQFPALAERHREVLRDVLRNSPDNEHRAAAVYLLGYLKDRRTVVGDLQHALRDPDEGVRANAVRALTAILLKSREEPEAGVRAEATWLVEMLNSLQWKDRMQAAKALAALTADNNPTLLVMVRERALDAVAGMARWKTPEHALPAFVLLGRVAGLTENEIEHFWKARAVETVIQRAQRRAK